MGPAQRVALILQRVSAMVWRDFATTLEQAFQRDGYSVQRLEGGAADLCLTRGGRTVLVAAKRWKAARHGTEALQALLDTMRARDASECHYVALGELSEPAKRLAQQHNVQLVHGVALAQLLRDLPVT
jgi:restriction system protein